MKILSKPIEAIAHAGMKGNISPLRFKATTKQNQDIILGDISSIMMSVDDNELYKTVFYKSIEEAKS